MPNELLVELSHRVEVLFPRHLARLGLLRSLHNDHDSHRYFSFVDGVFPPSNHATNGTPPNRQASPLFVSATRKETHMAADPAAECPIARPARLGTTRMPASPTSSKRSELEVARLCGARRTSHCHDRHAANRRREQCLDWKIVERREGDRPVRTTDLREARGPDANTAELAEDVGVLRVGMKAVPAGFGFAGEPAELLRLDPDRPAANLPAVAAVALAGALEKNRDLLRSAAGRSGSCPDTSSSPSRTFATLPRASQRPNAATLEIAPFHSRARRLRGSAHNVRGFQSSTVIAHRS